MLVTGLVVARQHPPTANGVVFLLLEDEHGPTNVIVPTEAYKHTRELVNHSPFLLVRGRFERHGPVLNVVARQVRRLDTPALTHRLYDFH